MTDTLRARIAKAIAGAVYGHNTLETVWADLHEDAQDQYFAEADAVIRELGLEPQAHYDPDCDHYRYTSQIGLRQMPDDLRTRISDIAGEHRFADHQIAFGDKCVCGWTSQDIAHSDHLADAVIRELEADYIRALLPQREGAWGWLDGTVSTNPATGNPIKLEIEPGEVTPLSVEDARNVALALLAAVFECEAADD